MVLVEFQNQGILMCSVVNVMRKGLNAQAVAAKKVEFNAAIAYQCLMEIVPINLLYLLK